VEAVAIMSAESARITNAEHLNNNGSIDRGLFQINSVHGEASTFDPVKNAGYAFRLSQGGKNWTAWAAYNNGAYQKYMPELRRFKLYHPWRWLRLVDGWRNNS